MKHLVKSHCNTCLYKKHRDWTDKNPERVREYRDKDSWTLAKRCNRLGISPEEFVTKFEAQGGLCQICTKEITIIDSAIDHNHKTGQFRGVLCKKCNRALGMFEDSKRILLSAYEYLKNNGSYEGHKK